MEQKFTSTRLIISFVLLLSFQMSELLLLGPYFVSAAVTVLPSHLRERKIQESWLKLFQMISGLMKRGYPEVEYRLDDQEKAILRYEHIGCFIARRSKNDWFGLKLTFMCHRPLFFHSSSIE